MKKKKKIICEKSSKTIHSKTFDVKFFIFKREKEIKPSKTTKNNKTHKSKQQNKTNKS